MTIGTIEACEKAYALVKVERQTMCGECHACDGLGERKSCQLRCLNQCQGKVGDCVEIDLSQDLFMKVTMIMYGIPLVGLLSGLALGRLIPITYGLHIQELGMIGLGGLFMMIGFWWIKKRDQANKYLEWMPVLRRVIKD